MDDISTNVACGKSLRPVRNRRYSRKTFGTGPGPAKRLFTPEIKRYLKEWLVRRRDNPYPNRDEKKYLATETGLTYIQICNWFANWRRKLKNVGHDHHRKTWGHLIKTYNDQAQGNVEQFSICSEDSIWGEPEQPNPYFADDYESDSGSDNYYDSKNNYNNYEFNNKIPQCYQISSTTEDSKVNQMISCINNNEYKSNVHEKNSKEIILDKPVDSYDSEHATNSNTSGPLLLSKWLESAAKFKPKQYNYACWTGKSQSKYDLLQAAAIRHGREEVEAAVALTTLASSKSFRA